MHSNISNVGNIQNIQNFNINVQNTQSNAGVTNPGETNKGSEENESEIKLKAQEKRYEQLESRFLDMEQQHMALAAQLIRKDEYFQEALNENKTIID